MWKLVSAVFFGWQHCCAPQHSSWLIKLFAESRTCFEWNAWALDAKREINQKISPKIALIGGPPSRSLAHTASVIRTKSVWCFGEARCQVAWEVWQRKFIAKGNLIRQRAVWWVKSVIDASAVWTPHRLRDNKWLRCVESSSRTICRDVFCGSFYRQLWCRRLCSKHSICYSSLIVMCMCMSHWIKPVQDYAVILTEAILGTKSHI